MLSVLPAPPSSALYESRALYHTLVTCTFAPWRVSRDEEIWAGLRENGVIIYEGGKKEGVNQNGALSPATRLLRNLEPEKSSRERGRELVIRQAAGGSIFFFFSRRATAKNLSSIDPPPEISVDLISTASIRQLPGKLFSIVRDNILTTSRGAPLSLFNNYYFADENNFAQP
ncbi:unnamed protein product [Xylocopa violacea]|uniref:Uncharacterized protein n=1 Tax=Xylocopa violacea TaxID=135666 RepID=A0ABP1NI71_XYLVO